ncbi:hypothetical protein ISF_00881 [Cordyceps fumosorosea ARSEF 2679]|uniref:Uncharacterized protein n=1 Tax=Cordyceps fumosorosea (strain ARSEF 2679) TaxID=1081104 RepID=A0A168EM81_CORFA|nr:hypothetical protein ISF_00881 [Cordyceps fumosorosea ARSEF 2679]OAA73980.1 hypothetical protein ISF_00881 [Cordyceps fumosorosea ARSEF 2679]
MSSTNLAASPQTTTSPTRRHQIKRSLSELTSPGKPSRTRKERLGNGNYDEGSGVAGASGTRLLRQPPLAPSDARMSLDTPRSNNLSPTMSPDQSRRGSVLIPPVAPSLARESKEQQQRASSMESSGNAAQLRQSQARIAGRTETLTQSLAELNDFSANASRQLDDAYYAVLEKMSALHVTIASLKGLAETSHAIHETFERDSRGLENQIATQLGAMGHFQNHQAKVTALRRRIDKGRARVGALGDRVDAVRQRIERWERADRQWQERTRRRLKIVWSVMSAAVLVLIVLMWTVSSSGGSSGTPDGKGRAAAARGGATDDLGRAISVLEPLNSSDSRQPPGPEVTETRRTRILWKTPVRGTDRLRAFDEL